MVVKYARGYKNLRVWQMSMQLTDAIYSLTKNFPNEEKYGLVSQMRRCAVSIPSNIAEGSIRNTPKEFAQFVGVALGSMAELDTQIIIAKNNDYISGASYQGLELMIDDIGKMMISLQNKMRQTPKRNTANA